MNYSDFTNMFIEMEAQSNLFEIVIDDLLIWQFIRTMVFEDLRKPNIIKIVAQNDNVKRSDDSRLNIEKISEFFFHNQYFFGKKDIIFLNHPRKIQENNFYVCKYTDELIKSSKYSYYVLEHGYFGFGYSHFKPNEIKNVRFIGREYFFKRLYRKEYNINEIKKAARQIYSIIKAYFGEGVPKDFESSVYRQIIKFISLWQGKEKYFSFIFKQVRPKIIILTNEYNLLNESLIYCAKKEGIPTVGLQHGLIGSSHSAYNYPEKMKNKVKIFPDYFFVWGDYHKKGVRWPIDEEKVISTGFAYFEKKKEDIEKKLIGNKYSDKKTVLFISGGRALAEVAIKLSTVLDAAKYNLVFKLHPTEITGWKECYPEMEGSTVYVNDDYNAELYGLILSSDCIICTGSTCAIEAVAFGKKTIIAKVGDYDLNLPLVNEGLAYLTESELVIADIIQYKDDIKGRNEDLICKNAIDNFSREVEKIFNK